MRKVLLTSIIAIAVALIFLLYASRNKRVMVSYHGAAPEVPQGRVFVIFNPFRDRDSENIAQQLIQNLRTEKCEQVLHEFDATEAPRVCAVMRSTHKTSLIWRQDGARARLLVYDIPEKQAHLWITSHQDEVGMVITSVSVIQ